MLYVKNFTSYEDLVKELSTGKYIGVLIKVGSERCPPCVALDKGPLEDLTFIVNGKLYEKQLLTLNINLSKDNPEILFNKLHIQGPDSIPAFYLFKYDITNNSLLKVNEERGYDMQNPIRWKNNFADLIISKIS